jgi:hypothetical protein
MLPRSTVPIYLYWYLNKRILHIYVPFTDLSAYKRIRGVYIRKHPGGGGVSAHAIWGKNMKKEGKEKRGNFEGK